jgi:crotonobetainyl-CoA:carnitine CoA-transferase CaiB-like acyl-CoA transferase
VPRPLGSAHQTSAPYQALEAQDGYFTVGATSTRNWTAFCEALGLTHLRDDPRFRENHLRHQNRRALIPLIEAVTLQQPAAHWVEKLQKAGVPSGRLQTYDQVFGDPHLEARGFFTDAPHSKLGPVRQIGSPMRLSRTPARIERAGPMLGEHSAEVLRELGHSPEEIRRLAEARVIGTTT